MENTVNTQLKEIFNSNKALFMEQKDYLMTTFAWEKVISKTMFIEDCYVMRTRFLDNCREIGEVIGMDDHKGNKLELVAYEHRSSDSLIVNGRYNCPEGKLPYSEMTAWFDHKDYDSAAGLMIHILNNFKRYVQIRTCRKLQKNT